MAVQTQIHQSLQLGFLIAGWNELRAQGPQFLLLSTSARCLIHGIMARSLAPTSSIG
jgi:hypothetical protein